MPLATLNQRPSLINDIGALAGLYRTVFWMMGRKAQYGRIWPREADMGEPEEALGTTELFLASQTIPDIAPRRSSVEAGTRD